MWKRFLFFTLRVLFSSVNEVTSIEVTSTLLRYHIGTIRTTGVETIVTFNLFCEFILPFLKQANIEVHPAWCGVPDTDEPVQAADVTNIAGEGTGIMMSQQLGQGAIQSNELL